MKRGHEAGREMGRETGREMGRETGREMGREGRGKRKERRKRGKFNFSALFIYPQFGYNKEEGVTIFRLVN